jgi:hypothetical protein
MSVQHPIPIGTKLHRLTVIALAANTRFQQRQYLCRCDCGCEVIVRGYSLGQGRTKSCGCLHREGLARRNHRHGKSETLTYNSWRGMIDRCENPNHVGYKDYGGRGIRICPEWRDFERFAQDMGERPSRNHSIERIDVDRNYEPGNCRWATASEQNSNKRAFWRLAHNGESLTVREWSARTGLSRGNIYQRLAKGWPVERVLTEPSHRGM